MTLKARPDTCGSVEILENYYFSPRRHPENVKNVEQKKKTLLQWIDLIERREESKNVLGGCITQREDGFRRAERCALLFFSYVAKSRADLA